MSNVSFEHQILKDAFYGNTERLTSLLARMHQNDRANLKQAAETLAQVLDPNSWCGACGGFIDDDPGLTKFYTPTTRWHHDCGLRAMNNHTLAENAF